MKKIIFMFVLLFAPLIVKAECSTDEVIRLKSLASKISITYDYTEKNDYISFSATFHNVHKDLKLIDVTNKEYSSNEEFSDVKIDNLNFSGTYYVNIVSKLQNCKNELMLKKYYTIPYYNSYSSDELCKGNETKTVCQKWTNTSSITYEQFKKALEEKKDTDTKTSEDDQKSTKPSIITELFVKYYYILFGGIIVISLTLIIVINKKNSFDFNT